LLLEEELMRILQATWSAKLRHDFPHLSFEVTVHDWDDPHGPTIPWRRVG
jgi:hypothetical protein